MKIEIEKKTLDKNTKLCDKYRGFLRIEENKRMEWMIIN